MTMTRKKAAEKENQEHKEKMTEKGIEGVQPRDIGSNEEMIAGKNGKFDTFYNNSNIGKMRKKPDDRTPCAEMMTQDKGKCAAAKLCKCSNMPLSKLHRCVVCAFCLHPECGKELKATNEHKIPSSSINLICNACVKEGDMEKFIKNEEISLANFAVNKYLRPSYPKINLMIPEEPDFSSGSESESGAKAKDDNQESGRQMDEKQDAMDIDQDQKKEEKMEIDDDDDANDDGKSAVTATKSNSQSNEKEVPKEIIAQIEETPLYMDVHLNVPKTKDDGGILDMIATLSSRLEAWLKEIQGLDGSFKLHTVDPSSQTLKVLHHTKDFPTNKLAEIKEFFKGARPIPNGGKLFMKIKASFKSSVKELIGNAEWFHSNNKELFRPSSIQACHVDIVGWLLYSTRSMDKERLQETLTQAIGEQVSVRWMRINDGSGWVKGRDTSQDPRALHIECDAHLSNKIELSIKTIYGTSSNTFPLHVRMRFVPAFSKLVDMGSISKFRVLTNRQDLWSKQHVAKSRDDIVEIDRVCKDQDMTLRDMIMSIKSQENDTPVFASIDKKWRGTGYNFSFHPSKSMEALMVLKGLFPRLAYEFGEENIKPFFTSKAIIIGRQMKYDPNKKTVTTLADEAIDDLASIDLDMVIESTPEAAPQFGTRAQILEKERTDNDSVSTFQSKRSPPTEIATSSAKKAKTSDDHSSTTSTSSLSATTKHSITTINTRITAMETEIRGFQSKMDSQVNLILQSLNIQKSRENTHISITPEKPKEKPNVDNRLATSSTDTPGEPQGSPGNG